MIEAYWNLSRISCSINNIILYYFVLLIFDVRYYIFRAAREKYVYPIFHFWESDISSDAIAMVLFDGGHVITEGWGVEVFRCPATFSQTSLGRSFEFSSRRREACRPSCILPFLDSTCERSVRACVRACVHVDMSVRSRTPVSLGILVVSPFGIRQGYRGFSGRMFIVIGVGRVDHLNTRHCNHDRVPSLSF